MSRVTWMFTSSVPTQILPGSIDDSDIVMIVA
jgi:hypothetical protein